MLITVDRVLSLAPSKFPSPNSLLLFPEYTPCSSSPQSFVVLLSLFQNNEERWKSLPVVILTHIFVRLLIKSIIICTSVSKTWKSKSKTQLSFPTISTTPTTKTKTSSSSGWQKKKWVFFLLMISSQMTTTKKFTDYITKMMMTQMLISVNY